MDKIRGSISSKWYLKLRITVFVYQYVCMMRTVSKKNPKWAINNCMGKLFFEHGLIKL